MAIYIYRSTDTDAPVLSNTAGTLLTVLDACLVNGYGSKSPVGWSITQTGTNLRTYRAATGNRHELAIDDTTTTYARARMFSGGTTTAAGVAGASGTNPCPTDAQMSGGGYLSKVGGSTRPWVLISNGTIIHFFADYSVDGNTGIMWSFGDFTSFKTGDTGNTIIICSSTTVNTGCQYHTQISSLQSGLTAHYIYERYDGGTYSINVGKTPINGCEIYSIGSSINTGRLIIIPNPIDNRIMLTPFAIIENYTTSSSYGLIRGRLPGIWTVCGKNTSLNLGDTITGDISSNANGKTFEAFRIYSSCVILIETSDTWDSVNFY